MPETPTVEELVADLRVLRMRGLIRLRHTDLGHLQVVADLFRALVAPQVTGSAVDHQAVENLLRAAVAQMSGVLGAAAAATFGLDRSHRDRPASERRRQAALAYNVSIERFRKHHEHIVLDQVAEEILKLVTRPGLARRAAAQADPRSMIAYCGLVKGVELRIVVRVEQVELLTGADILVVPTNCYLELPQYYKSSVSALVRKMAAVKDAEGRVLVDVVGNEVGAWVAGNAKPGLAVAPGTVAPTSSGEMITQGIRRLYHVAIVTPRPWSNDYIVEPLAIVNGVRNVLATGQAEAARYRPPLRSIAFPLVGAGRGGLSPATSFDWMWSAIEREAAEAGRWEIHFFTRAQSVADLMTGRISAAGLRPVTQE